MKRAIGWGLVAEAYANFGYSGVIGVALILGIVCGVLTRWSVGASPISLAALVAIAAMGCLINMEADAANLLTTMTQSAIAVFILYTIFTTLTGREQKRAASAALALNRPHRAV